MSTLGTGTGTQPAGECVYKRSQQDVPKGAEWWGRGGGCKEKHPRATGWLRWVTQLEK